MLCEVLGLECGVARWSVENDEWKERGDEVFGLRR